VAPRPLAAADLDRVVAIERAAFSDPWPRGAFEELLAEPHVRCLATDGEDGQLAGYGIFAVAADQGEILNLAVQSGSRRRGLGRGLLEAMLEAMRRAGVAAVHLEVRQSNRAAIHLYAHAGFRSVSIRRAYYRNPTEHAVTMSLDLMAESAQKG
jgi:ribosomal-protein-alanine N-acetyltransferase